MFLPVGPMFAEILRTAVLASGTASSRAGVVRGSSMSERVAGGGSTEGSGSAPSPGLAPPLPEINSSPAVSEGPASAGWLGVGGWMASLPNSKAAGAAPSRPNAAADRAGKLDCETDVEPARCEGTTVKE